MRVGLSARALLPLVCLLLACEDEPSGQSTAADAALAGARDAGVLAGAVLNDAELNDAALNAAAAHAATSPADAAARDAMPLAPCTAVAPTACPEPAPTYAQVAEIIERRCSGCHSPRWTGPWPLDTYQHVADWQDSIRSMLLDCVMPPADAGGPLPDEESAVMLGFIRCGLPMK